MEGQSGNQKKGTAAAAQESWAKRSSATPPQRLYQLIYTFMHILKRSLRCGSVMQWKRFIFGAGDSDFGSANLAVLHCFLFLRYSFFFTICNCDSNIEEDCMLHACFPLASHLSCFPPYKTRLMKKRSVQKNCIDIDCLFSFNRKTLEKKLALSTEDFEAWMVPLHLLFMQRVCSCGGGGITLCTEIKKERIKGNRYFWWKRRGCRKKVDFYSSTFF